jgi:hypothetical protein
MLFWGKKAARQWLARLARAGKDRSCVLMLAQLQRLHACVYPVSGRGITSSADGIVCSAQGLAVWLMHKPIAFPEQYAESAKAELVRLFEFGPGEITWLQDWHSFHRFGPKARGCLFFFVPSLLPTCQAQPSLPAVVFAWLGLELAKASLAFLQPGSCTATDWMNWRSLVTGCVRCRAAMVQSGGFCQSWWGVWFHPSRNSDA